MKKDENRVKKRHWALIAYPESVPCDWLKILEKTCYPIAISPLHDKDIKDETDEEKKPHWHVIIAFDSPKSKSFVTKITEALNAPPPQHLSNVKSYYRYLTHEDDPEKFHYEKDEIKHLNGFNIKDFSELSKSEEREINKQIEEIVFNENITEFSDLILRLKKETEELIDYARKNVIYFNTLVTSIRHKIYKK